MKLYQIYVTMKSRTNLKLGHVGSKSMLLDEILEKAFYTQKVLKFNYNIYETFSNYLFV